MFTYLLTSLISLMVSVDVKHHVYLPTPPSSQTKAPDSNQPFISVLIVTRTCFFFTLSDGT